MKLKKLIPSVVVITLVLAAFHSTGIHAQTPVVSPGSPTLTPTPTIVKSDFAIDLEEGKKATANDQEAKQKQKEQKDNEDVDVNEQGEVRPETEGIDENDLEQSSDDLNQEVEKDKKEEEKSDEQRSGSSSTSGTQRETTQEETGTQPKD